MTDGGRASLVVIVDDQPGVADFVARVLRRAVPAASLPPVRVALTPDEALGIMEAAPADVGPILVVSDFNMGTSTNGLELLDEVARRFPGARRVLMSGYSEDDLPPDLPSHGLDGFLRKPCDVSEIAALLRRLVDGPG